jgi:soluble lytic murein transglycosylase
MSRPTRTRRHGPCAWRGGFRGAVRVPLPSVAGERAPTWGSAHPTLALRSYTGPVRSSSRPAVTLLLVLVLGTATTFVVREARSLPGSELRPQLVPTVYDPYASELLAPYGVLRDAVANGDAATLRELAFSDDGYVAYLAATELGSWETLDPRERLEALTRQRQLRIDDPLRRAENRASTLALAAVAEAADDTNAALAAYRDALPDPRAVAAMQRLETDPYRLAAALQSAGLAGAALEALDGRSAPSIEAPSLRSLGRYQEALAAYRRWLQEVPDSGTAALGEAWCLYYLQRDDEAEAAFAALGADGAFGRGLIANRRGDVDAAVALLASTGRSDHLWLATGLLEARDRYTEAVPLYLRLARGGSSHADDAAYRAYVLANRVGMPDAAAQAASLVPRGSFFGLKLGHAPAAPDPAAAAALVAPDPASGATQDPSVADAAADTDEQGASATELASIHHAMKVANELYAIHEPEAAVGELLFALRRAEALGDAGTVVAVAEALQSMDEYRHSVRAARALLGAGEDGLRVWRLAYPPAWPETVLAAAGEHDVEPHLIWAVMRQESAFSEVAVSHANAQGLMQVIPSTWDWIAELRSEDPGDPFDVRDNIQYGATYLAWLQRYFAGDIELVIASYNGGQGYVRRLFESDWVAQDKDDFYREIDRSETREYLQRVYENLAVYRVLYPSLTTVSPALADADANDR